MKIADRISSVLESISPPPIIRVMIWTALLGFIIIQAFLNAQDREIKTLKLACESTSYSSKAKACEELNKVYDDAINESASLRKIMGTHAE